MSVSFLVVAVVTCSVVAPVVCAGGWLFADSSFALPHPPVIINKVNNTNNNIVFFVFAPLIYNAQHYYALVFG
jgi:hypothetical protein